MEYTLLIVEDDEDDLMLLADYLKHCQQQVSLTHAYNGLQAIHYLQTGLRPTLMLIDAHMPLMDGYELVSWLMHSPDFRHIPMVIWSGELAQAEMTRYYQAGANAVMLKQGALQDVEAFCRHWFNLVQLPQALSENNR